jgi:hypothetical protein
MRPAGRQFDMPGLEIRYLSADQKLKNKGWIDDKYDFEAILRQKRYFYGFFEMFSEYK